LYLLLVSAELRLFLCRGEAISCLGLQIQAAAAEKDSAHAHQKNKSHRSKTKSAATSDFSLRCQSVEKKLEQDVLGDSDSAEADC